MLVSVSRNERAYLAGLGLLTACSWGRWLGTGSLKVDDNVPRLAVATALFLALLGGWALVIASFRGLLGDAIDDRRAAGMPVARIRRLSFIGLAVASLMLPMLSNDVFQLFSFSSLAARGYDVFTSSAAFPASEWHAHVSARWSATLCHYGPVSLVAAMPAAWAHGSAFVGVFLVRAFWLVPLVAVMLLSFRLLPDRRAFHTLVWLNPLWLLEGPGQLHCDLIGLVLVIAGVALALRGRTAAAIFLYALAVVSKYTVVVVGAWFLLFDPQSARRRLARALGMAMAVGLTGAAFYAPFWQGTRTLTAPVADILLEKPGGTLVEVVTDLALAARGASPPPPGQAPATAADERASLGQAWFVVAAVKLALRVVTLGIAAHLLYAMLKRHGPEAAALGTGALIVLTATLGAPKFEPWYLLPALPFFGLSSTPAWRRWLTGAVALSVLPTFANVLPVSSPLFPAWGVLSTGANVAWFFAFFRARYLTTFTGMADVAPRPARA